MMKKVGGGGQKEVDYHHHHLLGSGGGGGGAAESEFKDISNSEINSPADPMMNDVILEILFKLNPPGELNQYRLVCKHWYNVALPMWLKNGSAKMIKSHDSFLKFLKEVHLAPSTAHEDIVGMKEYRKFHLEADADDKTYNRLHFEVFLNECGVYLTHLTLKSLKIPDVATFKEILYCKFTPNLEYLVVDVQRMEGPVEPQLLTYGLPEEKNLNLTTLMIDIDDVDEESAALGFRPFPVHWKSLLNNYPKLKDFGVGRGISQVISEVDQILQAITEIREEDKGKLNLTSLKWFFNQCNICQLEKLNPSSISLILQRQCQLPLEAFRFCFARENEEDDMAAIIHGVLSTYSKTLVKLELHGEPPLERCPFPQQMPQLETLELLGVPIPDLHFLKKLPNLRSLRLWEDYCTSPYVWWDKFGFGYKPNLDIIMSGMLGPFSSISEFSCNYGFQWRALELFGLGRFMPNINHLGLCLDDDTFPLIGCYFPQLEQLDVYGGPLGDDGILGFGANGGFHRAYITRLQDLKSLSLKVGHKFTTNSVIHGLLKLPRLEKLVIEADLDYEGQAQLKEFILEKLPFAKVHFPEDACLACGQVYDDDDDEQLVRDMNNKLGISNF